MAAVWALYLTEGSGCSCLSPRQEIPLLSAMQLHICSFTLFIHTHISAPYVSATHSASSLAPSCSAIYAALGSLGPLPCCVEVLEFLGMQHLGPLAPSHVALGSLGPFPFRILCSTGVLGSP